MSNIFPLTVAWHDIVLSRGEIGCTSDNAGADRTPVAPSPGHCASRRRAACSRHAPGSSGPGRRSCCGRPRGMVPVWPPYWVVRGSVMLTPPVAIGTSRRLTSPYFVVLSGPPQFQPQGLPSALRTIGLDPGAGDVGRDALDRVGVGDHVGGGSRAWAWWRFRRARRRKDTSWLTCNDRGVALGRATGPRGRSCDRSCPACRSPASR